MAFCAIRRILVILILTVIGMAGIFFVFANRSAIFNPPSITAKTIVEYEMFFDCLHSMRWHKTVPGEWIGMRRNDLSRKLIFWKLLAFDGGKVIVRREYHDLCQACKEKRYLGLQNHQVALYRGIPGLGRLEKVLPDIQISALPMEEVDDLSKGIPVTSEREMLQIIEGWSEKPD